MENRPSEFVFKHFANQKPPIRKRTQIKSTKAVSCGKYPNNFSNRRTLADNNFSPIAVIIIIIDAVVVVVVIVVGKLVHSTSYFDFLQETI